MKPGQRPGLCSGGVPDSRLQRTLAACAADLPPAWRERVEGFLSTPAGVRLSQHLADRVAAGVEVYPGDPFRALREVVPGAVRVVILGQDPYHGPGQAHGLAFSVAEGVRIPPSLRNIRHELASDLGLTLPEGGDLSPWARAGVLLLNTCLSVERDQAASHARLGWETLTDALLTTVAAEPHPKVFLLWGAHAQAKQALITSSGLRRHGVFTSNHPSPLSARRPPLPFIGSRPFSSANAWLTQMGAAEVDWRLMRTGT